MSVAARNSLGTSCCNAWPGLPSGLSSKRRAPGIQVTAWLMHHELGDSAVQLRVALRVWDLRTDQSIDVILCAGLVLFSKDQLEVGMWKDPFLELNGAIVSDDPAQDAFVHQEMQNLLDLWMKTLAKMSGRSAAVCPGSKLLRISGQLELQVMVLHIHGFGCPEMAAC